MLIMDETLMFLPSYQTNVNEIQLKLHYGQNIHKKYEEKNKSGLKGRCLYE